MLIDKIFFVSSFFAIFVNLVFLLNLFSNSTTKTKKNKNNFLTKWKKVAIIVPAYNEERNIRETIISLSNLDYPLDKLKIIVVDDGSKDNTYKIAKETALFINKSKKRRIVHVYHKKNGGKASALNYGIKKVLDKVDYIVCMDADSIVDKRALKELIKILIEKEKEGYIACVSTMNVYNPSNLLEKMQTIEYYISNFFRKLFFKNKWLYITPGPFSLYKSEFFKKHGLFKEDDITEDTEIGLRINAEGYKIAYAENSLVYTKTPKTLKGLLKQRVRWYLGLIENIVKYINKKNSKNLGEIGFFILPTVIFSWFLLFLINILIIKNWVNALYHDVKDLIILRSNTLYLIKDFFEQFSFHFSFSYYHFFFLIGFIFILFYFLNSLYSYTKSELDKKWIKKKFELVKWFLYFVFIYPFFYSLFIVFTFLVKLFGKEIRFGNLKWNNSILFLIYRKIIKILSKYI